MNSPYVKHVLVQEGLKFVPLLIRKTLLGEPRFREEYGFVEDRIIFFGDSGISIQCSTLFDAVRKVLSGASEKKVINKKGQKWRLKNSNKKEDFPSLSLSRGKERFYLPTFFALLSPDTEVRLRSLDKVASDVKLPGSASDSWRDIISKRALEDDEVNTFHNEALDTPVAKTQAVHSEIMGGQTSVSSLVPSSRRYFERLVGVYDESVSIRDYASGSGRKLFDQLSAWRPYDGFLYSLFLSSHASLTEEINVDQLNSEDLVHAFEFLDKHGDRISQLGAIEVGLRVFALRPEIEQALIRLIGHIRDDDVDGQASGFNLLSALFCLVDGQLSRTRLFSSEPPFYRRLAALSHTALIHRQLVSLSIDIDKFSEWAFSNCGWFYIQSLVDMRSEPRWNPNFAMASRMKADFLGRILIASKKYEQNIASSQIHDLVFGDGAGSLQPFNDFLETWFPGPLEGAEDTQNFLPPEFAEAIETQLGTEEVGPSSFPALVNSALVFCIGADQAELATTALKYANHRIPNIENRQDLVDILDGLAKVAAVSRSLSLADELQILVRRYRHDAEYALSIREVIIMCLVVAASRSDLNEWTEFVGDWLTELAFSDLNDDEAREFHSWLNCLCHIVPELWVSCGRADAALSALINK